MQKLIPPRRILQSRIRARELLVRARNSWVIFRNAVDRSIAERADTAFRVCGELAEQSFLVEGKYAGIAAIGREKRRGLGRDERGRVDTELHKAARDGDVSRLEEFILGGADANACDHNGRTAGHLAALYGYTECLKLLIDAGLDVTIQSNDGWTVGHSAALNGHTECLKLLIAAGLDVNIRGNDGWTAGHWAAYNGHAECLELLIEAGLNVNTQDNDGWTAGHLAAFNGHAECSRILEEAAKKRVEE